MSTLEHHVFPRDFIVTLRGMKGMPLGILVVISTAMCVACSNIPSGLSSAPKIVKADGNSYVACHGFIVVYEPSRDVADSSQKTYEITFTDDFGKPQDLKGVKVYTIRRAGEGEALNYAMPAEAIASNTSTTYSNGQPLHAGDTVTFSDSGTKAKWQGPGKWEPVPCE